MRKNDLAKFILKYWNKLKIFWIILSVIAMIVATRTYINYSIIKEAIEKVQLDIKNVEEEIAYSEKFLKPYLDSEFAEYFLAHKNNILFDWEYIIRFQAPIESNIKEEQKTNTNVLIETPQQSRQHFIKSKLGQ